MTSLPGKKDVPEKYKAEAWAYLGVDIDHDFEPLYIVPDDKKKQVKKLKDALKDRPTTSISRRTKTARGRRSAGICKRC